MKVKARDIVHGWPRGRTTSGGGYYLVRLWYILFFRSWSSDREDFEFEYEYETAYHQMQQAMVNEWFARKRLSWRESQWGTKP